MLGPWELKTLITIIFFGLFAGSILVYLADSKINAVEWQAPVSAGYIGSFQSANNILPVGLLELAGHSGPEDITTDVNGVLYVSTAQGYILKFDEEAQTFNEWAFTGGFPLGIRFDKNNNLIVADAALGLLMISPNRKIAILVNQFDGEQLGFVDALDIADNGVIYFSDASNKFSPRDFGGPKLASELDIFEHGKNGAIYAYDPSSHSTKLLIDDLHFANGVALTPDQQSLLVVETAKYRVLKYSLNGERKGSLIPLIDNLPGFPDNIVRHPKFGYWLGLTAPRSSALDKLSQWPKLRSFIYKLPSFMRPVAQSYGHVVHIDETGQVITSLQDPSGSYGMTTGALQVADTLYITSLNANALAVRDMPPQIYAQPNGE